MLLKLYRPLQEWLLKRADVIVGTTPVYLAESPFLTRVQPKVKCLPIGIEPVPACPERTGELLGRYPEKKIIFALGRLVEYKGYRYLIEATRYLRDDYVVLIGGEGVLKEELQNEIVTLGAEEKVKLLGRILPLFHTEDGGVRHRADRGDVVRETCGSHAHFPFGCGVGERARGVGAERDAA